MEVIAKARHIRISPRKVRLVADLVRGLDVSKATAQLRFFRKDAARPILKAIESAVANAEHNFKLPTVHLFVKTITVDGGPVLKRWRARAFGRAAGIRKRSSHITVILDERIQGTPKGLSAAVIKPVESVENAKSKTDKTVKKTIIKRAKKTPPVVTKA